jgi:hypothetical protein
VAASPPGPGCPPRGARRSPCGAGRSVATAAARGSRAGRPCSSGRRRCARSSSQPAVVIESRNHGASITTPRATPPNGFSFTPPRQTLRLPGPLAPMVPWHGPASGAQVWTHYTVIFTASCSAATHISNRWCHSGLRLLYTVLVVRTAQQQHRPTGSTSPPTHPPGRGGETAVIIILIPRHQQAPTHSRELDPAVWVRGSCLPEPRCVRSPQAPRALHAQHHRPVEAGEPLQTRQKGIMG